MEDILLFLVEGLAECVCEVFCDACFCGLWSDRREGFDDKPRRKGLS